MLPDGRPGPHIQLAIVHYFLGHWHSTRPKYRDQSGSDISGRKLWITVSQSVNLYLSESSLSAAWVTPA